MQDMSDYNQPSGHTQYSFAGPNYNTQGATTTEFYAQAYQSLNSGSCNSDNGGALRISCDDGTSQTWSNAQLNDTYITLHANTVNPGTCTVYSLEGWTQSFHTACHRQLKSAMWLSGGAPQTCQ
jgi:hypothetical protein